MNPQAVKRIVAIICIVGFIVSCRSSSKKSEAKETESLDTSAVKFAGVFSDTIPCADCSGIAITADLKPDHTYVLEEDYLEGKGEHINYDVGTWTITDSILNLSNTTEKPRQFKVLNHAEISVLDNEGKMITGPGLNFNIMRSLKPFTPRKPIPVKGMFSGIEDTMQIYICAMNKTFAAAIQPDVQTMKTEYAKEKAKKDTIMAYVEGHFELRPSLQNTGTEDFFVIERFKKFAPSESCSNK